MIAFYQKFYKEIVRKMYELITLSFQPYVDYFTTDYIQLNKYVCNVWTLSLVQANYRTQETISFHRGQLAKKPSCAQREARKITYKEVLNYFLIM